MISIIIPTNNEQENILRVIDYLKSHGDNQISEIIITHAGNTNIIAGLPKRADARVVKCSKQNRAAQMNYGASLATGKILYFAHADNLPPDTFENDICKAVNQGWNLGGYQARFNSAKTSLRYNPFAPRFNWTLNYGSDQTLFITKSLFDTINGFNENMLIMEDHDLVTRAKQFAKYKTLKKVSAYAVRKDT